MDILKQCQKWHENDEHQKIVDVLEALPAEERTPETDMELARAYNNLADPYKPGGRALLKKAIGLMQAHEEELGDTYSWNFRMGYAWYYLDQEGRALPRLRKALELHPGDDPQYNTRQEIEELIGDCEARIALPRFAQCFRERTESAWEAFAEMEAELRRMMDEDKDHTRGAELVAHMEESLNLAFDEISFEMGFNGEKYELILTPEGDKVKLFELVYFQKHAPKEVLEHWNILVGRQPNQNIGLRTEDGWNIAGDDVQVWLEEQGENSFALSAYCEKLLSMLREAEGRVWWMLTTLTDQVLGEVPHMRYIGSFDVLDAPRAEPSFPLSRLPDKLREKGLDLSCDPEGYLESYLSYQLDPNDDPDADWRLDTIVGSTCCAALVNGYLNADNDFMDDLHADGAVAGFLCYPLDTLREEEGTDKIFNFRDRLEEALAAGDGPEILTLTGGATGLFCGYVDFIAWDIQAVLQKAKEFFEGTDIPWATFHTFRREAGTVNLKKPPEEEPEDESDESDADRTGVFTGFVLLSKGEWDREQFIRDMKEKWDIDVEEDDAGEEKDGDTLLFEVGDMLAAVSLAGYPIPDGEAETNAENNYMWEDAVKAAKEHRAHLMVAVLGKEENLLEKGKLFTKVVAACCRQKYAAGIYTSGVVFEPLFYEGFADMMKDGDLPVFNWIWYGLYRSEDGICGYTYGMEAFGKDEMEVLDTDASPNQLRDFLASLASYVLENDVELHDGETIGFSAEDKHTITRSPGVGLPEEQMTLKISWEPSDGGPDGEEDDGGDDPDGEASHGEEHADPEVYTEEEMTAVENHIQRYFGPFEHVYHELASPDIHVDICVAPPSEERDYYTLVTMGMGAHRMNVPAELAEYKLERAELAIALPGNWKLKHEDLKNERWYWPIRLLKDLARLPIASDTWLAWGHTMDQQEDFAESTKLCAAILTGPQGTEDGREVCTLPGGEEVNFYQVIPLYRDELEYKLAHGAEALLDKMEGISFVVHPDRPDALTMGTLAAEPVEAFDMDDAAWHLETIREKHLPMDELNAYNHMAIYLRWCMEHDLMSAEFMERYLDTVEQFRADPAGVDLRPFIRDELGGQLFSALFNDKGTDFAWYYYGKLDAPYYPSDIDNYAIGVIGPERNYSDEIQDEAYLFIPFDEDYYRAMAGVIYRRFVNWQRQDFDEDSLEPSDTAKAIMKYLGCECTYFPSMKDDDPIMAAYSYARRDAAHEGFVPVLIRADDETLLECLIMNADPAHDADGCTFDPDKVAESRKKMLSAPVGDGKAVLEEMTGQRQAEAEDDELDWAGEVLGEMVGGYENDRLASYWDADSEMTVPVILAKVPVKRPWEVFAWLPFGGWNECPDTPDLMAAAKYWFEQYGAAPAALSHDELEFLLPAPVPEGRAMEAAAEQYGFCPDVIDQGPEDATLGALADTLRQSTVWYFWWD